MFQANVCHVAAICIVLLDMQKTHTLFLIINQCCIFEKMPQFIGSDKKEQKCCICMEELCNSRNITEMHINSSHCLICWLFLSSRVFRHIVSHDYCFTSCLIKMYHFSLSDFCEQKLLYKFVAELNESVPAPVIYSLQIYAM